MKSNQNANNTHILCLIFKFQRFLIDNTSLLFHSYHLLHLQARSFSLRMLWNEWVNKSKNDSEEHLCRKDERG